MSVFLTEKDRHMHLVNKSNAVIARDGERLIVVHSRRTMKPLLPFEITKEVFQHWNKRDNRVGFTDTPYQELFGSSVMDRHVLVRVTDFNEIQFSED